MATPSPVRPRSAALARQASMRRSFALIHRRHDASDNACVDLPDEGSPRDETLKMDDRGKATLRPPPRRHGSGKHGHSRGSKSAVTPSPPAGHRAIPSAAAKKIPPPLCARRKHKHSQMTAKEAYEMVLLLSEEKLSERRLHSSLGSAMQDGLHEDSGRVEMSAAEIEADGQLSQRRIRDVAAQPQPQKQHYQHRGFRNDYQLGETLRHPSHAVRRPNPEAALPAVESMSRGDFAFVLRSDGSHTYSMLAHRSEEPPRRRVKDEPAEEACMIFVITEDGSTKMVRRRNWADCVLLPAKEEQASSRTRPWCSPRLEQHLDSIQICGETAQLELYQESQADPEEYVAEDDWVPPGMITFDRDEEQDNGCSVISSVSERARFFNRQQRQIRRKRRELQQ